MRCCSDEVHYVPVISGEKEYIDNSSELELLMLGSTNSLATEDSGGRLVDIGNVCTMLYWYGSVVYMLYSYAGVLLFLFCSG